MANYANPNHPGRGLLSRAVEHKFSSNTDMVKIRKRLGSDNHTWYWNEELYLDGIKLKKLEREVFEDDTRGAPRIHFEKGIKFIIFDSNPEAIALNDQGEWVYAPYDAHSYENTTEYIGQTVSRARKTLLVSKLIVARAVEFSL
jgi:hypothetical protein